MFEKVLETIKEYDRIIIHRHSNPDGDALGSQIGLKNILIENFPDKEVYVVGNCIFNTIIFALYAEYELASGHIFFCSA